MTRRCWLSVPVLLLVVNASVVADYYYYHWGNYRVSVTPCQVFPGRSIRVSFNYRVSGPSDNPPYACPWEVRLDGTAEQRDGVLLESGSLQRWSEWSLFRDVVEHPVIPLDTPPGQHTVKIITSAHPDFPDSAWTTDYSYWTLTVLQPPPVVADAGPDTTVEQTHPWGAWAVCGSDATGGGLGHVWGIGYSGIEPPPSGDRMEWTIQGDIFDAPRIHAVLALVVRNQPTYVDNRVSFQDSDGIWHELGLLDPPPEGEDLSTTCFVLDVSWLGAAWHKVRIDSYNVRVMDVEVCYFRVEHPAGDLLTYEWREGETVLGNRPKYTWWFNLGEHALTLTVTDKLGSSASDDVTVIVEDTQPPTGTLTVLEPTISPPKGKNKLVLAATLSEVSDICDVDPSAAINVSANEPIKGPGEGKKSDWEIVENGDGWEIWLRAESDAPSEGREYYVSTTLTDASGNSALLGPETITVAAKGKGKPKKPR